MQCVSNDCHYQYHLADSIFDALSLSHAICPSSLHSVMKKSSEIENIIWKIKFNFEQVCLPRAYAREVKQLFCLSVVVVVVVVGTKLPDFAF